MSRIGRLPISLPPGVSVSVVDNQITIVGPKGELSYSLLPGISVAVDGDKIRVSRVEDTKELRAYHGLTRSLIANMVTGISQGFEKVLELVGVGYRAEKLGSDVVLQVGFSHPVRIKPLSGVSLDIEGSNKVRVYGVDKGIVGQMAANIRAIRPPDPYKGKGIRYSGEIIKLKPGKAGKAIGGKK